MDLEEAFTHSEQELQNILDSYGEALTQEEQTLQDMQDSLDSCGKALAQAEQDIQNILDSYDYDLDRDDEDELY